MASTEELKKLYDDSIKSYQANPQSVELENIMRAAGIAWNTSSTGGAPSATSSGSAVNRDFTPAEIAAAKEDQGSTNFKFDDDFLETVLDVATNVGTFGTIGYDDGKFGKGLNSEFIVDTLKDITGASAVEEANAQAEKRVNDEKQRDLERRKEAKNQSGRNQIRLSRLAGRGRGGGRTAASTSGGIGGSRFSQLGDDEQDFLGL